MTMMINRTRYWNNQKQLLDTSLANGGKELTHIKVGPNDDLKELGANYVKRESWLVCRPQRATHLQ